MLPKIISKRINTNLIELKQRLRSLNVPFSIDQRDRDQSVLFATIKNKPVTINLFSKQIKGLDNDPLSGSLLDWLG